jgi:type I restriction enzyme, S subunit
MSSGVAALPSTWAEAPLAMFLRRIEAGLNVKCEERPPQIHEAGLVKISAVTWGRFDQAQSKTLPNNVEVDERNLIRPGDLLISRANTIELVGACVIVENVTRRLYLSDKVLRLVVHEPAKRWIHYALKTPKLRSAIEAASCGNQLSMRNISQEGLRSLTLPVAPEAEQQRIVDKLDTVLARIDAVNDRLARVAPLLKRFRQAVLAAATSGRLTDDWRELNAPTNPWDESTLVHLIDEMRNGLATKPDEAPRGRKILRISAVRPASLDASDHRYLTTDESEGKLYELRKGDVLFTRYNGSLDYVGVCAMVSEDLPNYVFPDKLIRVRVKTNVVLPRFVELAASSLGARAQIESFVKSSAGQKGISGANLKRLKIGVPSLGEQTEIVRRVDILFAFADRLEARLQAAQTAASRLTPALLAKAFRGELVPQDPADEPAADLLRRLAANPPSASVKQPRGRKATA